MIGYKCSRCGAALETDDSLSSKPEHCPACGHLNTVPKSKEQLKEERRREKEAKAARQAREVAEQREREAVRREAERARAEEEKRRYKAALAQAKKDPQAGKNRYSRIEGKEWGPMPESRLQKKSQDAPNGSGPRCPKCGSAYYSANKKGMDAGIACCGALLIGPLGLLCGLSDKVVVTCLNCGHQWKAGKQWAGR